VEALAGERAQGGAHDLIATHGEVLVGTARH
jgi:hypothetical protein